MLFPTFSSVLYKQRRKWAVVGFFSPVYLNPQSSAQHHLQSSTVKKNYRLMENELNFPLEDKSGKGFQKLLKKEKKRRCLLPSVTFASWWQNSGEAWRALGGGCSATWGHQPPSWGHVPRACLSAAAPRISPSLGSIRSDARRPSHCGAGGIGTLPALSIDLYIKYVQGVV